jgi:membrane protein
MSSLWTLGGLSWTALARRVWREGVEDNLFGRSAELAFYFLFSIFPLLLFLTALFGYVVGESTDLRRELFDYLRRVVPSRETLGLVRDTLQEIIARRGLKLSLGLVFSLWAAAQGVAAIGRVLDTAYDVERRRPLWREQLIAVALTILFATLTVTALVLIFQGTSIASWLAARFSYGAAFVVAWRVLQWPVVLLFLLVAFELVYNLAPSGIGERPLYWSTPGAVAAMVLWLAASFGFRGYLARFNLYNWAYGSLGTVIVLMLWFYLTGFAILVGGELNAEISKAVAEREKRGKKRPVRRR